MTKDNKQQLFKELKERVDQFHNETEELSLLLVKITRDIDDGRLPMTNILSNASEKITSVGELRKLCETSYKEFGRDELPASFDEFSDEIVKIETLLDKTEYIETKEFLLKLTVHDDNVAELFEQLKKELLEIDIDSLSNDECSQAMNKYVLLKKMLTAAPEDRVGHMLNLADVFDQRILSLAITGAYSSSDSIDATDEREKPKAYEEYISEEGEQKTIFDLTDTAEKGEEATSDVVVDELIDTENANESEYDADFEDADEETEDDEAFVEQYYGRDIDSLIDETGYEFIDASSLNISVEEAETQAKKAFSVKKFKESLRGKPYDSSVRKLLVALGVFRAFFYEAENNNFGFWPELRKDDQFNYDEAVNYLLKKGYVRILSADNYPKIVGPTKKGEELIKNKTACDFIKLDYVKDNSVPPVLPEPESFLSLLLRLQIFELMGDSDSFNESFSEFLQNAFGDDQGIMYTAAVPKDKEQLEVYLGAVVSNTNDKELKEVHVFQVTKEQAKSACTMLSFLDNDSITSETKFIPHYYGEEVSDDRNDTEENDKESIKKSSLKQEILEEKTTEERKIESSNNTKDDKEELEIDEKVEIHEEVETDEVIPTIPKSAELDYQSINEKVLEFINQDKLYCATAYIGAAAHKDESKMGAYGKLAYAINDPAVHCTYTSDMLFDVYTNFDTESDYYFQVAAVLRLFFAGQSRYDYNLQQIHDSISGNPALSNNSPLNDLIYNLRSFRTNTGFTADKYADYRSHDRVELEREIDRLRRDAADYYETDFINQRMIQTKTINRRYEATWRAIFSKDNDFGESLKAVVDDDAGMVDLARDYISETFIKEGMPVSAENIDPRRVENYIDNEWEKAINQVALRMKSSNLFGSIRNNLRQHLLKDINTICNWIEVHDALGDNKDSGHDAYAAIRDMLISLSAEAIDIITGQIEEADDSVSAGLKVLCYTVDEIKRKLDGSYKFSEQRYFYLDFLKTNYVILGEDYLPDFDCTIQSIDDMDMMRRIESHSEECENASLEENLNDYCSDNFGSAKLIADYLSKSLEKRPEILKTLPEAEKNAEEQIEFTKRDFESDLMLAQSCGQLDADNAEDKMDSILHIADKWFSWAEGTHNFGFYKDLLEKIRQQIRTDALARGEIIRKELDSLLKDNAALERDNADYVERIKKTIDRQNYLVAEDMINHLLAGDIPQDVELFEDDYLADFQNKYSYYYKLAGSSGAYLANLVKTNNLKGLSNKDLKGATTLKDNWAKPGSPITIDRLKNMLNTLGITVDKIAPANQSGVYNVRVRKTIHEDEKSYGHPIYGFGSVAARDGFRVIWLSGSYNADALISKCNELGRGKHTIAFLDHSLTASERRRLARKIKEDGSKKIFGVVDRALYMYLIHNYSTTYISRMLMETMMPYAYFQPYVYDSATAMPPEMFMGRKDELEKIKDPAGVNIVYGGRQLGKSALLKKAKADINGDLENNRAVLIDIKDLDYKATARKISQTLIDEKVIDTPIKDETDWSEIARTLKNTLRESKSIRYLLLMLDEADRFLESCEEVNYSPFDALKDIQQSVDPGRFKFVVAGLRNVVRFNKAATSGNSVLPHLEPLIVKPFTTLEARALLEQPLYYLGFRFPEDAAEERADLVPMILATANYFPGLIQMYCAKLIEALRKNYGGYNENNTPPYVIEENLIKSVLAESTFRSEIREKFMITLRVGGDEYYYILALILAYLYRNNDRENGFTASEILTAAKELETKYIGKMTVDQIDALMLELCELNVMRVTSDNRYLFSRRSFLSMMGTSVEVEDRLLSYIE